MYRENEVEMKQMLVSILNMATYYEEQTQNGVHKDKYESHIFFDGAIVAGKIENHGLQLLSLVESTLNVKLRNTWRKKTPYGYTLTWEIGITVKMPFVIHFKDKTLVKPKKRWSQVMYMNYVLNYRTVKDQLNFNDTFILTTDADIDFKASSVVVLLDMLATNTNIAAVCARTHPKGNGLMYWYQLFDYAIGHWFQKPAEHILGSVLCSPGCFSIFRCSALKQVLDEYSTEATSGSEFLMKDMGEDRWLCTLLIKKGLRLEYCAVSEDQTYCPTKFEEFFKQRRRWIPSTLANLLMLVSESNIITKGNDSISILYILFEVIMIFSTAISPATVILIVSAGMETFHVPFAATVIVLSLISVLYGLICLYASPKTQLDVSKLLTFVFALIMAVVIVGITRDIIDDAVGFQGKIPTGPGDCGKFDETGFDECLKGQDYAANLTNELYTPFRLRVSVTTVYMAVLAGTFLIAALLHLNEFYCLLHFIWYLLGLPSGESIIMCAWELTYCSNNVGLYHQEIPRPHGIYCAWVQIPALSTKIRA
jgi:chitin synthase